MSTPAFGAASESPTGCGAVPAVLAAFKPNYRTSINPASKKLVEWCSQVGVAPFGLDREFGEDDVARLGPASWAPATRTALRKDQPRWRQANRACREKGA